MTNGSVNATGVGVGLSLIFSSQVFPFMLSSAFTARTIVKQKGQVEKVQHDALIATGVSIAFAVVLAYFMHDWLIAGIGTAFAFILFWLYMDRGELL